MTLRRTFGMLTLLAMVHFIVVGTAAACAAPGTSSAAGSSAHANCAPTSSHSRSGSTDRTSELPCCTALASCATAPLASRTIATIASEPAQVVVAGTAERAPRAEIPAPELPPPRA